MKNMANFLLFTLLFSGCYTNGPNSLIEKSPYEAGFDANYKRLSRKHPKEKHLMAMEWAFQSAQKADLIAVDSMLNLDSSPDRWLYINAYHRRLQERQLKVLAIMPLESKDGYKPDFLIIPNLAERETASRQQSAAYLYEKAKSHLATGTKGGAREAHSILLNLRERYFLVWENSAALLDSAAVLGVEHVLIEGVLNPGLWMRSGWQKFYTSASDRSEFDVIIRSHGLNVRVGPDYNYVTTHTETREIEVGYNEKKDSSGVVIERSPIYESVSATITETILEKDASGTVLVDVYDGQTDSLVYATTLSANTIFSDKSILITGDRRALSSCVMEQFHILSSPTYWAMEDKIVDALHFDFRAFVTSKLWSDK